MYSQDNDETYVRVKQVQLTPEPVPQLLFDPQDSPMTPGNTYLIWAGMLNPYIKSHAVDLCPDGPVPASPGVDTTNFDGIMDTLTNDAQVTIGYNAAIDPLGSYGCEKGLPGDTSGCSEMPTEASFPYPAQTPAFADSYANTSAATTGATLGSNPTNPLPVALVVDAGFPLNISGGLTNRHTNGTNIGFLDGHAKYYPIGQVYANAVSLSALAGLLGGGGFSGSSPIVEADGCSNYDKAHLYWDRTATDPQAPGAPTTCTVP